MKERRWLVVVPDRVEGPALVEERVFQGKGTVIALNAKDNAGLDARIEDADAILAWHDLSWDKALLSRLKKCKALVRVGAGTDNVDLAFARSRGIAVSNVPDYGTDDVADHALGLLLSLARGLSGNVRKAQQGASGWYWGGVPSFRLTGRKMGIVGLGRIGTATTLRAKAFGMQIGYYDPYRPAGWDKALGVRQFTDLHELAQWSDVVSLHTPLTQETRGMIGEGFFAALKAGAVLINVARGPIVDWQAFAAAFTSGKISAAGFDVLPVEPIDETDPLLRAWIEGEGDVRDRMMITPHCAFFCPEALEEMRRKAAEEALRILEGRRALNRVND